MEHEAYKRMLDSPGSAATGGMLNISCLGDTPDILPETSTDDQNEDNSEPEEAHEASHPLAC